MNMVHGETEKQTPFEGHYAFTVVPSMMKEGWVIDSGASSHVCYDVDMLVSSYRLEKPVNVHLPDGTVKIVTHCGDARINKYIYLKEVLLVPGFTHNLLSVAQLNQDSGTKCVFMDSHCVIQNKGNDKILGIGKMVNNLYLMETVAENYYCNLFDSRSLSAKQWHIFLGHPSLTTMKHIKGISVEFTDVIVQELEQCEICFKTKQCREPFPVLERRTAHLFDLVHADIWGSYAEDNLCGTKFMLTIVEDHSRVTWTYMLDCKEKVFTVFHIFIKMIQNQFGHTIKVLRTDKGGEFMSSRFNQMLDSYGILHQKSCVYTPQQNGIVERKHRTLLDSTRALMFQSSLPDKFWPYSIMTTTWMIKTGCPVEFWIGKHHMRCCLDMLQT